MVPAPATIPEDRRKGKRYPIREWVILCRRTKNRNTFTVVGMTTDISYTGVLIENYNAPVKLGMKVTIDMQWPVLLDNIIPMKMIRHGRVIRIETKYVAIKFCGAPEFRTRSTSTL